MGFMTVVVCLNDQISCINKSPKTAAYLISHAPMGRKNMDDLSNIHLQFDEPRIHSQALNVLPTFHADDVQYLKVGYNDCTHLEFLESGVDKKTGKKWIKLTERED